MLSLADTDAVVELGKAFISYALVAFTAYSGNSAVEKWLVRKYGGIANESTADEDTACG